MALRPVGARLVLENQSGFIRGMNRASSSVDGFETTVKGASASTIALGTTLGNLASGGLMAAGRGLLRVAQAGAGFLSGSVSQAAALEAQMSRVSAVLGATGEELTLLKGLVQDLGLDPNLKVSSLEAAQAIEVLAKNGLTVTEIMGGAAKATVALANATGADFATAADIATDAMSLFNIGAGEMSIAIDGITGVTTSSKLGINDYRLAIANAGAIAAGAGISFEDFNTVIAATASSFASGSDAGTSFKTTIQRLANPTKEAAALMEELGISLFDAAGNTRPMSEVVGQLNTALGGMTEAQRAATAAQLGGADAARTIIALSTMSAASFTALSASVNAAGQAQESAATRVANLSGALDIASGVIESIRLSIGDKFIPVLTELTNATSSFLEANAERFIGFFSQGATFITVLTASLLAGQGALAAFGQALAAVGIDESLISRFQNFANSVQQVIGVVSTFVTQHAAAFQGAFTALAAVLASAGIAATLAGIASAITALVTPMGLLIAGITLLGAAWAENWGGIRDITAEAMATIVPLVTQGVGAIQEIWITHGQTILETTTQVWGLVAGLFGGIFESITMIFTAFTEAFNGNWLAFGTGLVEAWITNWSAMIEFLGGLWDLIQPVLVSLFGSITSWFMAQDWQGIAQSAIQLLVEGLNIFWDLAQPVLATWFTALSGWFTAQDWASLARSAVTSLTPGFALLRVESLKTFDEFLGDTKSWFEGQDWESIGKVVGMKLAEGAKAIFNFITVTLPGFLGNVKNWFTSIDWAAFTQPAGEDLVSGIIEGLKASGLAMLNAISEFATGVVDGFRAAWGASSPSTVMMEIAADLVAGLIVGITNNINAFLDTLATLVEAGKAKIASFVSEFKKVGEELVLGLIDGVKAKAGALAQAALGVVNRALEKAKSALGISSPSKEFFIIGTQMINGLVLGLREGGPEVDAALDEILGRGKIFGGFGGFTALVDDSEGAKALENAKKQQAFLNDQIQLLREMRREGLATADVMSELTFGADADAEKFINAQTAIIESLNRQIETQLRGDVAFGEFLEGLQSVTPALEDVLKETVQVTGPGGGIAKLFQREILDPLTQVVDRYDTDIARATEQLLMTAPESPLADFTQRFLELQTGQRAAEIEKIADAQERLLNIQKQQQQLDFLNEQQKLLDLISKNELDAGQILGGLQLGIEANASDLLDAMSRALGAVIQKTNETLQIASPSKVFERIGAQIMEGLQLGLQNSDVLAPVASAQQIATTAINNVNNREININYTNNSGAPLSDSSELDFLLASYA